MPKPHLFSVIVVTYNRLPLLREAVNALQRQTYDNLELILVNNGSSDGTFEFLSQLAQSDDRVKLVHFEENQFSLDDPNKPYAVSANAGLEITTGDYVLFHSHDDMISDDYAQKMVALFKENPECTTAIGLTINMDEHGTIMDEPRLNDYRPRYMPGHLMALDMLPGRQTLFGAQGCMFTVRRDVLVNAGGYHRSVDLGHLFGIVPFGVTGFDETAYFYFRRYSDVRLDFSIARAIARVNDTSSMLEEWEIQRRWQVFGDAVAQEVVSGLKMRVYNAAAQWFIRLIYSLHFMRAFRILRSMWYRRRFWLALPRNTYQSPQTRWFMLPLRPLVKAYAGRVFRLWPGLARLSPWLARINERLEK